MANGDRSLQSRLRGQQEEAEKREVAKAVVETPASAIATEDQREELKDLTGGLEAQARAEKHQDLNSLKDELNIQGALTDELRDLIDRLRKEPEREDLSPLLSVLDSQLGTNMLSTYKKPATKAESLAQAIRMHTQLQDVENKRMKLAAQLRGVNPDEVFSPEDRQYYNSLGIRDSELNRIAASPATATYQINKLVMQRTPSERQLNKIQDLDSAVVSLGEMQRDFQDDFVGPEKAFALQNLPEVITKRFETPEAAAWRSKVGRFFDTYRKAITGAQASLREIKFLQRNVPNIGDTPEQFKQKMKSFAEVFNRIRRNTLNKYRKQGKFVDAYLSPQADEATNIVENLKKQEEVGKQEAIDLGFEPID